MAGNITVIKNCSYDDVDVGVICNSEHPVHISRMDLDGLIERAILGKQMGAHHHSLPPPPSFSHGQIVGKSTGGLLSGPNSPSHSHTTGPTMAPPMTAANHMHPDVARALGAYWKLIAELPELHKNTNWYADPNGRTSPLRCELQRRPDVDEMYILVRVPPRNESDGEFFIAERYEIFPSEELLTKLRLIR